jgi:hypothetical protein
MGNVTIAGGYAMNEVKQKPYVIVDGDDDVLFSGLDDAFRFDTLELAIADANTRVHDDPSLTLYVVQLHERVWGKVDVLREKIS